MAKVSKTNKPKSVPPVKALQQKSTRRRWLTFMRMLRYGVNNLTRNAWLTIAASAVMTITLLVIFTTIAARTVLMDTAEGARDKIEMLIYLETGTDEDDVKAIEEKIDQLSTVTAVTSESPSEARSNFAEEQKANPDALAALNEATNKFPWTLRVKIVDINDPFELREFVRSDEDVQAAIDPDRPPSFEGERSAAINTIGRWVVFAERFGVGAAVVFIAISALIIFNTIRMAIFSRKDEIQMMKLIGADRSFIRGPFIVEAIFYGFIAAVIATAIGMSVLYASKDGLQSYGVKVETVVSFVTDYAVVTLLGMILIGAIIGVISSLLATRQYLKI